MKYDPQIHTQVHPKSSRPVHKGVYGVIEDNGDIGFSRWERRKWHFVGYNNTYGDDDAYAIDYAAKASEVRHSLTIEGVCWFGLRGKP